MKKIALIAGLIGVYGLAQATTINAPGSLVGTSVLNGNNAYAWNITTVVVPTGQQVDSATITFSNIKLTSANSTGIGYLYTDLLSLRSTTLAVSSYTDNDAAGDYFASQSFFNSSLGTKTFPTVGTTLSWSYVLNSAQLLSLNSYVAAGGFSFGIDSDCYYNVGALSFTYTTATTTVPHGGVPDAATTAYLLGASLLGLEVLRRKLTPAAKA